MCLYLVVVGHETGSLFPWLVGMGGPEAFLYISVDLHLPCIELKGQVLEPATGKSYVNITKT